MLTPAELRPDHHAQPDLADSISLKDDRKAKRKGREASFAVVSEKKVEDALCGLKGRGSVSSLLFFSLPCFWPLKWPLYARVELQVPTGHEARARVVEMLGHAAGGGLMVWHLIGRVLYEFFSLIG